MKHPVLMTQKFDFAEPNNESPLNAHAAELWSNQTAYKKLLLDKYEKEVRSKQSS